MVTRDEVAAGGGGPARGPVVVLSYAHADTGLLTRMLSANPAVVCTRGTGVLPLCQSAALSWQAVEGRQMLSDLAVKSIRAMVTAMAIVVRAGSGATRWCETAYAGRVPAETFLRVFPDATFLCLHRGLADVLADGIASYPWGLGGSPFWPYAANHPGSSVATITAYWAANTETLLDFEADHPKSCLRVRHEDLVAEPDGQAAGIFARLGLPGGEPAEPEVPWPRQRAAADTGRPLDAGLAADARSKLAQLPPQLLASASDLHARCGYGPLVR